jgi:hypothetical protein
MAGFISEHKSFSAGVGVSILTTIAGIFSSYLRAHHAYLIAAGFVGAVLLLWPLLHSLFAGKGDAAAVNSGAQAGRDNSGTQFVAEHSFVQTGDIHHHYAGPVAEQTEPANPNAILPTSPNPQGLRGQITDLAGDLCGYLISHGKELDPPHDPDANGLEFIPDDMEIVNSFDLEFGARLAAVRTGLGNVGLLLSNIGEVLEGGAANASSVRYIIDRLRDSIGLLDSRCGTKVPAVTVNPDTCARLFTPLQMEALRTAKDLRILLGEYPSAQTPEQFHRMRLDYEEKFAPSVKALMFKFSHEQGGEDSTLRRHIQFIDNGNDVLNVANALIRLAYMQDGIDVAVRYPS